MLPRRSLFAHGAALATGVLAAPRLALAAFPDRPVTMIVPYAPGGSADVLGRVVASEMSKVLGQTVVVELRAGAGGHIGGAYVANTARADGYTFLLASNSNATGPSLQNLSYDPIGGLTPLGGIGAVPMMCVVSPEAPWQTFQELLADARRRPGALNYGSSGIGTASHLAGELLSAATGATFTHVPYRGSGAVYPDLIGQRISFLLDAMGSSSGQARSGAVRALAVSSTARSAAFPNVPTIIEAGVPDYEFSTWLGFFTRTGTPSDAFARLEEANIKAIATPEVQEKLAQTGAQPLPTSAAPFGEYFRRQVATWKGLVDSGKLQRIDS
ncbi:Bug family tripartite tricarboxylate transporter substrate binding protein [Rhodovarius crocodyli]|nr:tripartite tricarboxylate transporter substrate binding protein [Rhodovarius crocodyli]